MAKYLFFNVTSRYMKKSLYINSFNNIRKFSTCSNNNNDNRKGIYLGSYLAGLFSLSPYLSKGNLPLSKLTYLCIQKRHRSIKVQTSTCTDLVV